METIAKDTIDNAPTVIIDWEKSDAYLDCIKRIKFLEKENDELRQFLKANFERPQGEWINHRNNYGHNIADCSLCGKAMQWHDEDDDGIPRYCWYCGANMRGKENG